jgi:hypothetical protein
MSAISLSLVPTPTHTHALSRTAYELFALLSASNRFARHLGSHGSITRRADVFDRGALRTQTESSHAGDNGMTAAVRHQSIQQQGPRVWEWSVVI